MLQYLFIYYLVFGLLFAVIFFKYFYFLEIQDKIFMSIFWLMVVSTILVLLLTATVIDRNLNEVRRFLKVFKSNSKS